MPEVIVLDGEGMSNHGPIGRPQIGIADAVLEDNLRDGDDAEMRSRTIEVHEQICEDGDDDEEDDDDDDDDDAAVEDGTVRRKLDKIIKQQKVSKSEAYRLTFLPHLKKLPSTRRGLVSLDTHDPASFTILQVGSVNPDDWSATAEEYETCRDRFEQNLRTLLHKYKDRARAAIQGETSIIPHTQASQLLNMDVESEVMEILAGMKKNTKGALGQRTFGLKDLADMDTFTSDDLMCWAVYIGFVKFKDGRVRGYVGSSIARTGCGARLVQNYERSLRYAKKNYFLSSLGGAGLARHAADSEVEEVHLRPMASFPIPDDEDGRSALGRKIRFREAFFMDLCQTMNLDANGSITLTGRTFGFVTMAKHSQSMKSEGSMFEYGGLNICSPLVVGAYQEDESRVGRVPQAEPSEDSAVEQPKPKKRKTASTSSSAATVAKVDESTDESQDDGILATKQRYEKALPRLQQAADAQKLEMQNKSSFDAFEAECGIHVANIPWVRDIANTKLAGYLNLYNTTQLNTLKRLMLPELRALDELAAVSFIWA